MYLKGEGIAKSGSNLIKLYSKLCIYVSRCRDSNTSYGDLAESNRRDIHDFACASSHTILDTGLSAFDCSETGGRRSYIFTQVAKKDSTRCTALPYSSHMRCKVRATFTNKEVKCDN